MGVSRKQSVAEHDIFRSFSQITRDRDVLKILAVKCECCTIQLCKPEAKYVIKLRNKRGTNVNGEQK
jgi:hypothetical protein